MQNTLGRNTPRGRGPKKGLVRPWQAGEKAQVKEDVTKAKNEV